MAWNLLHKSCLCNFLPLPKPFPRRIIHGHDNTRIWKMFCTQILSKWSIFWNGFKINDEMKLRNVSLYIWVHFLKFYVVISPLSKGKSAIRLFHNLIQCQFKFPPCIKVNFNEKSLFLVINSLKNELPLNFLLRTLICVGATPNLPILPP